MSHSVESAIAIVGLGAILPDAPNVERFWRNILDKRYSITPVPTGRWGRATYYDPDPRAPDKTYSNIGGWVHGFEFDWKRFRMPPKVAAAMDSSQQWAVTIAADALADYGYPHRPLDTERTAVILGAAMGGEQHYLTHMRVVFPEYAHALEAVDAWQALPADVRQDILHRWQETFEAEIPPINEDAMPGELANIVSGRVANILNLRGPNFITDAACASSFAAIEAAIELLREGKVDAVLTGGVDRNMGASMFVKFCKIGALSATGTRPFGEGADGFVMGEGAAAFLLKRLADAEAAGDKIYAVIRGVGGASDGKGKGITAPNPVGQQLAMERAWAAAGLDPASAGMVEAHGTSTRVGDVAEMESLKEVFAGAPRGAIGLGSVKSNIGHLKAGAGAAGLLKATLALHHRVLPPTLNANPPNPNIDFDDSPFYLLHDAREWERNGAPRRCGVSAYGFGGTNFHVVLEEYEPGLLEETGRESASVKVEPAGSPPPPRGILALGAATPAALVERLDDALHRVRAGWTPPAARPDLQVLAAPERLLIDFGDHRELANRLEKARKVIGFDTPRAWKAVEAQGIFRGSGGPNGKLAFLFPGQGSQYVNMGRELVAHYPVVAEVFADADRVMEPILGRPLTDYIFVDPDDNAAVNRAMTDLMQTAITQPAMLTMDIALHKLLGQYGFAPDMVMGHSLGEYAALIAAGILPFAEALEAAAARGGEMSKVSMADNGKMAAVLASPEEIEAVLAEVDGYVVPANINCRTQCVIGGASAAVDAAVALFEKREIRAIPIPVSHAFHTEIVAPAAGPLRQVLDRMHVAPPRLPLVANVDGKFYPTEVEAIKDNLERQVASPVEWVKGLETLYDAGVRSFVEVGPKRALRSFANDVFKEKPEVIALMTNHPKFGALATFNQALCGLYAAGFGTVSRTEPAAVEPAAAAAPAPGGRETTAIPHDDAGRRATMPVSPNSPGASLDRSLIEQLSRALGQSELSRYDRRRPPAGSVVISGTGLGLPGAEKSLMDPDNALRILHGEQFVDLIPERFRQKMVDKRVVRLVKDQDGSGSFATIDSRDEVVRLAGRPGAFDLHKEYGVPQKLVEALDVTTQMAMAAGLDALREAGIPLAMTYKETTTGKQLPQQWRLPPALRDETGVIFASAFPGGDRFADEFRRYYEHETRSRLLDELEALRQVTADEQTLRELKRRADALREELAADPYTFDRRFIFRVLAMGHSQFAQYIGARGPNTHVNVACASTAQAVAVAEDWIRTGRCRRVIVIAADNVTGDNLLEWVGAGFLAVGAVTTSDRVDEAALPFDRRRHGTILGMGACALVVESQDAVQERGMRAIVEVLNTETSNSAFHGTRLDVEHISQVMDNLISGAEHRFGLNRYAMAGQTVFVSHETFTPARGGSAAAEVHALRQVFGAAAAEIVVANTKGFTGHPMGVGVEDVIAVKILEHGIVPPVPNHKETDPDLGPLNLSRGGRYPVSYAIHLAAGFGSQISFTLLRRIPGKPERVDDRPRYQRWLDDISGYDYAELEVQQRVLRIKAQGPPPRPPAPGTWTYGTGPGTSVGTSDSTPVAPTAGHKPVPARAPAAPTPERLPQTVAAPPGPAAPERQPVPLEPPQPAGAPGGEKETVPALDTTPPGDAAAAGDGVASRVLALVSELTGYPPDMLDLDLDLEADLGIDTVKQAETFAAIREEFDIPRLDDLSLADYNTLEKVIRFVEAMTADRRPAAAGESPATPAADQQPPTDAPAPAGGSPAAGDVTTRVLALVSELTGYPPDMLDLDLDLEADLGIDTVKQAETFAAIREEFDIPRLDDLSLADYNTLEKVIRFVEAMTGDRRPAAAGESPATPAADQQPPTDAPAPAGGSPAAGDVTTRVLALVSELTGYPPDMLDLDLDLEADLGIDTVKQAETFAAIREEFDIPRLDDVSLADYSTLEKVIRFVEAMTADRRPPTAAGPVPQAPPATVGGPPTVDAVADQIPRRVPVPVLRPELALCKETGVALGAGTRIVVALDEGGVGEALVSRLKARDVSVLTLAADESGEMVAHRVGEWARQGPIQGVFWLTALDQEPALLEMDLATWREMNRRRVKNLSVTMRFLYGAIAGAGTFLVTATRLGGLHGYGSEGATAPLGGAVGGFTKAYGRERPEVLVKVVDFAPSRKTTALAELILAETERDPGAVEIGYWRDRRYAIGLEEQPPLDNGAALDLDEESVFLVTGAAGGITSAIVADLAAASGGIFYLLDLVEPPAPDDPRVALFRQGREQLKKSIIEGGRARNERLTPVQVENQILALERLDGALRAIEAVERAGGTAHYRSVNLLDGPALMGVVDEIRARHERIDVLIHAGGVEISRTLDQKPEEQFNLVYDVKADGFFTLLRAAEQMPIGAAVVFSSVAGRFGNRGQTDYSAANDLLCKMISSLRQWRSATYGLAIDWTAWGEIGMATRGSIPMMMEMAGIDLLPPAVGISFLRRELAGGGSGEVVAGGALGVLVRERDETGGLDLGAVHSLLANQEPPRVLLGQVRAAGVFSGLQVETTLDPAIQPFLRDHAMTGTPILPGVMGTEAFAQLATLLAPDYHVTAIVNETFAAPFKFYRDEPQTLYLSATASPLADGTLTAQVALSSRRELAKAELAPQEKSHFTATVLLAPEAPEAPTVPFDPPADEALPISAAQIYEVYFHGPAYQVLERAGISERRAVARLARNLPPNSEPVGAELMAPRLVEACFQTVGVWEIGTWQHMALPAGLRRLTTYAAPPDGVPLYAVVDAHDQGDTFDARVVDAAGNVFVELHGYRTVQLPGELVGAWSAAAETERT